MSFLRSIFSLKNAHRVVSYLKTNKFHAYFLHPVTLVSIAAVGIPFATIYCTNGKPEITENKLPDPFKLPETKDLSLKKLIQHSSYMSANAALQMVQLTTAAIIDSSKEYRESVSAQILVLNQSLDFVGLESTQGELNDLLIILRADTKQADSDLQEYLGFMEYVEKLGNAAAETTFLSGAEYPSFSLSEAIHDSQRRVAEQLVKNKRALDELNEIQTQVIVKSKKKEVTESSDSSYTDSDVISDDFIELDKNEPIEKPPNTYYNNF